MKDTLGKMIAELEESVEQSRATQRYWQEIELMMGNPMFDPKMIMDKVQRDTGINIQQYLKNNNAK